MALTILGLHVFTIDATMYIARDRGPRSLVASHMAATSVTLRSLGSRMSDFLVQAAPPLCWKRFFFFLLTVKFFGVKPTCLYGFDPSARRSLASFCCAVWFAAVCVLLICEPATSA